MSVILELESDEIRLSVCIPAALKRKLDNFTTRFAMKHGLSDLAVTEMASAILARALETGSVELEATPPLVSKADKTGPQRPKAAQGGPNAAGPKPTRPAGPAKPAPTYQSELRALVRAYPPRKFTPEEHTRYKRDLEDLKTKWSIQR